MKTMRRTVTLLLVVTMMASFLCNPLLASAAEKEIPPVETSSSPTTPPSISGDAGADSKSEQPTEPTGDTQPVPTETTASTETTVETTAPTETIAPTEAPTEPQKPTESTAPNETTVPSEPTETTTPTEPVETTAPTEVPTETTEPEEETTAPTEEELVSSLRAQFSSNGHSAAVEVVFLEGQEVSKETILSAVEQSLDTETLRAAMVKLGVESILDFFTFSLSTPNAQIPGNLHITLTFDNPTVKALDPGSVYVVEFLPDGATRIYGSVHTIQSENKCVSSMSFDIAQLCNGSQFVVFSSDVPSVASSCQTYPEYTIRAYNKPYPGIGASDGGLTYHCWAYDHNATAAEPGICLESNRVFGSGDGNFSSNIVNTVDASGDHSPNASWKGINANTRELLMLLCFYGLDDWSPASRFLNDIRGGKVFAAMQLVAWEWINGVEDGTYTSRYHPDVQDIAGQLRHLCYSNPDNIDCSKSYVYVVWPNAQKMFNGRLVWGQALISIHSYSLKPSTGSLTASKSVVGNGTVNNWKIELYNSWANASNATNPIASAYTDGSGSVKFDNLQPGTYYVREAPAGRQDRHDTNGWTLSTSVLSGNVTAGTVSHAGTITNHAPSAEITVKKGMNTASGSAGKLNGWIFQVSTNSAFTSIVKTLTTDSNGYATTGKTLAPGTYYVREAPMANQTRSDKDRYILDSAVVTVKVAANQTVAADHNGDGFTAVNQEKGEIAVQKAVSTTVGTSGKLNGWLFQISTDANFANVVKTLSTDAAGKANTGKTLAAGVYYVREAPYALQTRPDKDQYTLDASVQKVTVPAGGSVQALAYGNATATNHEKGRIRVSKGVEGIAADTNSLSGWVFLVLNNKGQEVATVTTGADGYGTTGYLVPGNYTVQEAPRDRQTRQDLPRWELSEESVKVTVTAGTVTDAFTPGNHTAVNYHGKFLKIQKVPDCPETVTAQLKGNDMYTLAGAKYHIIVGDKVVETLVTDADGRATSKTLFQKGDTGTLVETEAPSGYLLDVTPVPFTIPAGTEDYVVEVSDEPTFDPARFNLKKIDAVTGEPMGDASFAGAVFRWDYFDNLTGSGTPVRTWYFTTGDDGGYGYAPQYLADSSQYTSDDLFSDGTDYLLPIGSITVSEVFAPSGYTNIPQLQAAITQPSNGSYAKWEWSEESAKYLTEVSGGFEIPEPQDTTSFGALSIQKTDKDLGTNIPDSVNFAGCEFSVYNRSAKAVKVGDYAVAQPGEVCYVLTTDESGAASTNAIFPVGTYEVKETKGNDFFEINEQWSYTFSVADGKTQFATECANTMISIVIHVQKVNEAGDLLAGARFVLEWSEDGNTWTPVYPAQELSKGGCSSENLAADGSLVTDETGYATFTGLYPLGSYRITEVATPNGYSLLTEPILVKNPTHEQNFEVTYKVVDGYVFNLPKTGAADMPLLSLGIAISLLAGTMALIYFKKKEY